MSSCTPQNAHKFQVAPQTFLCHPARPASWEGGVRSPHARLGCTRGARSQRTHGGGVCTAAAGSRRGGMGTFGTGEKMLGNTRPKPAVAGTRHNLSCFTNTTATGARLYKTFSFAHEPGA
eukprot:gene9343-biopygen13761